MKSLVVYFSCSGMTQKVAEKLAIATNSDLYEILPENPYTNEDLNWRNKQSRTSIEMKDHSSRPAIKNKVKNMEKYDVVYIGFPIWWYVAPTIINTFLEQYDFSEKTIVTFFTSGGSELGNTISELKPSCSNTTKWVKGKRFSSSVSEQELKNWANSLNI